MSRHRVRRAAWILVLAALLSLPVLTGCQPPPAAVPPPPPPPPSSPPPAPVAKGPAPAQQGPLFQPGAQDLGPAALAARRDIDDEVKRVLRGQHGQLPPVAQVAEGGMGIPTVEVSNDTAAFLMVLFSGSCSAKVLVPPKQRAVGTLCAGPYTLAARLLSAEIQPYVRTGQEFANGATYRLTFFVIWQGSGPAAGQKGAKPALGTKAVPAPTRR